MPKREPGFTIIRSVEVPVASDDRKFTNPAIHKRPAMIIFGHQIYTISGGREL